MQLPRALRNKTNIHTTHTSQPVPTIVPTSLSSLHHSAIYSTTAASTSNNYAASSSSGQDQDKLASVRYDKSSKLASDPPDTGTLTITDNMNDDGEDSDYMRESDNESGSYDEDISSMDELAMDMEIEALGPKL